jgi:hypothetical protein
VFYFFCRAGRAGIKNPPDLLSRVHDILINRIPLSSRLSEATKMMMV